jgi:YesN/AraC family two-component response regulator
MSESVTSTPAATTQGQVADVSAGTDNKGAKATQETVPTQPQKFKVKVAGEEREITSDEALKDYELRQASYKRMAEAAAKEKEYKEFQEQLEKDPIKLLKSKNPKFRELAEKYLADELLEEMMSPEEKARRQIEDENKQLKKEKEERENQEKSAREAAESQKAAREIDTELTKALQNTFLPKDEFTVSRIANTMIAALQAGITDMSYEDAVKLTEDQEISSFRKGLTQLDGDRLLKYLGEDIAEKIRKADIGRLKTNPKAVRPVQAASTSTPSPKKEAASPMSPDEYRAFIEAKIKNKKSS